MSMFNTKRLKSRLNQSKKFFTRKLKWENVVSAAVACFTPVQGNLLADEGFETPTTGYQQGVFPTVPGWNVATGSPDPAYSIVGLTSNKPNGACLQGFRSNYSSTSVFNYNSWNSNTSSGSPVYVRFYLYISSHTIANGESAFIAGVFNSPTLMGVGLRNAYVAITNNAGQLEIYAEGSAHTNVSIGQWILVELKVALNATSNGSAIKINGGSELTFTDTGYGSWASVGIGTFGTTSDAFTFNDCAFDLVAADSANYIGPTP